MEHALADLKHTNLSIIEIAIKNGFSDKIFIKYNKNLMIIDASQSIEYTYNEDELWLDPSNFLMISLVNFLLVIYG